MQRLTNWLQSFRRDEKGSIAIETVLIIPALFWAYLALFAIFDVYRQYSVNQKAAFTLGDMVSRETTPIDNEYVDGSLELLQYLTNARDAADVSIRISSIAYRQDSDSFELDWSQTRGDAITPLAEADVADWHDRLPVMADNDHITVVETFVDYDPPFNTGLADREIRNFVFTKPRYSTWVCFVECPDGI